MRERFQIVLRFLRIIRKNDLYKYRIGSRSVLPNVLTFRETDPAQIDEIIDPVGDLVGI